MPAGGGCAFAIVSTDVYLAAAGEQPLLPRVVGLGSGREHSSVTAEPRSAPAAGRWPAVGQALNAGAMSLSAAPHDVGQEV